MLLWISLALIASVSYCQEDVTSVCLLPLDSGRGKREIERFYFDSAEGECKTFTYKGRKGNENNFKTIEACKKHCIDEEKLESECKEIPTTIANGQVNQITDARGRVALEFTCNEGFLLIGLPVVTCCNGEWVSEMPTCLVPDCKGLLESGETSDGLYSIYPGGNEVQAYCDMTTDGGGWTVIQRRVDDSVDFYLPWADYKVGFGDPAENFWIGLDNMHALTEFGTEVYFFMTAEDESRFARYDTFKIASEQQKYELRCGGYSGDAGDSFHWSNNAKFSTPDQDNDVWSEGSCAVTYHTAGWFNACYSANPNGQYLNGDTSVYAKGIVWVTYKDWYYSIPYFEMKIRRK